MSESHSTQKRCYKCKQPKDVEEFGICRSNRDGRQRACKECRRKVPQNVERKKKWYRENRQHVIARVKKNREANIDKHREAQRQDYQKKAQKYKDYQKLRRRRLKNDPIWKKRFNAYSRKYKKSTPHIQAWRAILSSTLRKLKKRKTTSTCKMLGYTAVELQQHIESLFSPGMSWNNHGEWHIDHIRDVATYPPDTLPSVINALSNLRPLWATTRIVDGVTYIGNLNRSKYQKEKHHEV